MRLALNAPVAVSGATVDEVAARATRAKAVYAALLCLGPEDAAERAELLAAGVPSATVETLYPSGFEHLVPGIVTHLAITGMQHLRAELTWLPQLAQLRSTSRFISAMTPLLQGTFRSDLEATQRQDLAGPLKRFIEPHLYPLTPWPAAVARDVASALWQAHWLAKHRAQLQDVAQRQADELLLLLAERVLPNLPVQQQPPSA